MEDFVKGSFLSVISFFVIVCLLIIGLPWLWNWIVFIFQSPLPAGQASKAYLIDSFMECLPFILTTGLILLSLDIVINRRYNSVEDEVELFVGSKVYVPTPQVESAQKTATEPPTEAKTDIPTQSRGESFDFSKYKQGSPEAANAYKNSQEAKENLDKLRTLDQLIEEARKATNNA